MRPINVLYFFCFYCFVGCVTIGHELMETMQNHQKYLELALLRGLVDLRKFARKFTSFCLKLTFQGKWKDWEIMINRLSATEQVNDMLH